MVCDRFQVAGVNFGGAFIMITRTCPTSTPHIDADGLKSVAYLDDILGGVLCFRPFVRF